MFRCVDNANSLQSGLRQSPKPRILTATLCVRTSHAQAVPTIRAGSTPRMTQGSSSGEIRFASAVALSQQLRRPLPFMSLQVLCGV